MNPTYAQIAPTIIAIIAEKALLQPSDISVETEIAALALDSLAMVELIFALEENFDIAVPFNANAPEQSDFDLRSVGSIIAAVEGLIAQRAA